MLVLARRDLNALAAFEVRIWLRDPDPAPEWAVWLARIQQVARGEPQLGFWVRVVEAGAGTNPKSGHPQPSLTSATLR